MNKHFLWITKDSNSKQLSHSSRPEESRIRHHVQRNRIESMKRERRSRNVQVPTPLNPSVVNLKPGEQRSLSYFIHRTAPEWSGWQDSGFWNGLALQAGQQDQAIAHGLIAIAAWHERSSTPSNSALAPQLRQLASSQYSRALALVCTSNELTYSASLISCVILASLQSYSGNYQEYRLLRSGMAMLEEVHKVGVTSDQQNFGAAHGTISREISDLINRLQERLCMMGDLPAALAYSVQYRTAQSHPKRDLPLIPTSFYTLRHARDCIESILNWGHDHVIEFQSSPATWNSFSDLLQEYIEQWEGALNATNFANTPNHHLHLLQISALNGEVLLLSYSAQEETAYDSYASVFRRIMHLITHIPSPNVYCGRVSFGIDCSLIDVVAFVGTRCREPTIRRSALDWLQNSPRFEGERLSSDTAEIVQAWIDLEEPELVYSSADTPESRRRRLLVGERYHAQRVVKLLFSSSPYVPAAGAQVDVVWVRTDMQTDLMEADMVVCSERMPIITPDVIIGPSHAAFLDRKKGMYHHLHTTTFHFPIPRA